MDANKVAAGSFTVTGGGVGGWSINSTSIYTGTEDHSGYTANDGDMTIYSNCTDSSIHAKNFYITTAGDLVARDVDLTGAITATSGSFTGTVTSTAGAIGGWTLGASTLTTTGAGIGKTGQNQAFWAGSDTQNSAAFRVSHAGALVATSATISGVITVTAGSNVAAGATANQSDAAALAAAESCDQDSGSVGGWAIAATSISSASSSPKITIANEAHTDGPYILISE